MKLTFSKSEPFHSGWRGWSNYVDVVLDGAVVGQLFAKDCDRKRDMDYRFTSDDPRFAKVEVCEIGIRAAKAKVRAAIEEIAK